MKKINLLIILSIFLLLNFVSAVTVVSVPPAEQPQPETPKTHWYDFVGSPIFWLAIAILFLFALFGLIIFFLVRWLVKFIKQRNDIFWRMRTDRMLMAKIHGKLSGNHWLKVTKNPPVRLMKMNEHGEVYLTKPIGYYRGDFIGHEGSYCIAMNLVGKKKYWFFPTRDLLVVPNKEKIKIIHRDANGLKVKEEEFNLPLAKDVVQFNENEVILKAEGVSQAGIFLVPVLKDKDGKHMDLSLPSYTMLKDVILGDYLYEQSQDYVVGMRKAIDMSPHIRGHIKTNDANNSVEVSSSQAPQ